MNVLTKYQKDALELTKHISLTANAGSGKTTVLSQRYVEILLKNKISINNIVAITFTEKAASELYSKIAKELDSRLSQADSRQYHKLEKLRRSLVSAKISTIHAFCMDILKDYAPEAGIDANFSPIDTRTSEELLDQSISEEVTSKLLLESQSIKNLIRIFGTRFQLVKNVKQLFYKRKSINRLINTIYQYKENELSAWFQCKFEEQLNLLFDDKIKKIIQNVIFINNIAASYKISEKHIEINRLIDSIKIKKSVIDQLFLLNEIKDNILTKKGEVIKRGFLSTNLYEENSSLIEETNELFEELKNIEITKDYKILNLNLARFGKEIIQFYQSINDRYEIKKNQKSYLDFEDLLLITQDLLKKEEVINSLSAKYKYIMIDEYQDTNETQYNIFMPILKNLSSGNLFVVGDEKQSIYMFREAEVELFDRTKKEIEKAENSASILELPHSFRLAPSIALFTNVLFRKIFKNPSSNFNEVKYNELVCAYPKENVGYVDFLISNKDDISEADLVARKIARLVEDTNSGYRFEDIAILCTKRKNFSELEQALGKHKIVFSIIGGKGYYQQQLIFDVFNYLSFLINPQNDLALANILRAPYFGLSDVQLTKVFFASGSCLKDKLELFQEHASIVKILTRHISLVKILRPNDLIRKINNDTGYWGYIGSKPNSKQEIANLEKLIQKSIQINENGFNTLFDFVNYLRNAINNLDDEGQADLESDENSVKIMTIHQSKGLEFKVVILYKTNQKIFNEKIKSKDVIVEKNFGILSKLPIGNNYFDEYQQAPIIGIYNYIQKRKTLAEHKRLLYVAVTRAEEHLIISAQKKWNKFLPDSFASMIFEAIEVNDQPEVILKDKLSFMKLKGDNYSFEDKIIELKIPVTNLIETVDVKNKTANIHKDEKFFINTNRIQSYEKNEIISASKISLFLNCPKKYELTYEFGYGELTKLFRSEFIFEFNNKEDELNLPANLVGSIAHTILEKDVKPHEINKSVIQFIDKEESSIKLNKNQKNNLVEEITQLMNDYYRSDSAEYLLSFNNTKNELALYKRENDYYLFGIIDKLIVCDDKVIVVDYKTDKVNFSNFDEKKNTYLNQLFFYSYLLLNKYPNTKEFELKIVFLRDDKFSITQKVNRIEILKFGEIIKNSVAKIRSKKFDDFKPGCRDMRNYFLSNPS